jgi:phage repressor protein C with HTH and peptisase S24 domain
MLNLHPVSASRMKSRLKELGFTQASLAKLVGVDQTTISNLISGKIENSRHLPNIAKALSTTTDYLTNLIDDPSANAPPLAQADLINEHLDLVQISMIDLKFGMGGGAVFDAPVEIRKLSVSRAWISLFTNAKPECVFVAEGRGDSNAPTINDGDLVFFDTSQNQPTMSDEFWAMTHYGHGVFKRLRPTQGGYKIMSDNPLISDDIATDGEMAIIGRVIAIMRRM